ncbi:MAG: 30S ribosomal protein S6 [Candidatus Omnitrophica bacterium]|nr:30S ribosomal protein S6 [Candidatus Omnitrophota bacterium]
MNKYEAMCIIRPDLSEEARKGVLAQINEAVTKRQGNVLSASIWAERRKLFFPIKKHMEGVYYLMNFTAPTEAIKELRHAYKLNEDILRVLITRAQ